MRALTVPTARWPFVVVAECRSAASEAGPGDDKDELLHSRATAIPKAPQSKRLPLRFIRRCRIAPHLTVYGPGGASIGSFWLTRSRKGVPASSGHGMASHRSVAWLQLQGQRREVVARGRGEHRDQTIFTVR
mgnify:CR=1 FL=1